MQIIPRFFLFLLFGFFFTAISHGESYDKQPKEEGNYSAPVVEYVLNRNNEQSSEDHGLFQGNFAATTEDFKEASLIRDKSYEVHEENYETNSQNNPFSRDVRTPPDISDKLSPPSDQLVEPMAANITDEQLDDWTPPDPLAVATSRLVEELTKHGLSSSSPFALLLDPQADVWGAAESRNSVLSFPLGQADTMARAAAAFAWQSPAFQKVRDAVAPCTNPDADLTTCFREGVLGLLVRTARAKEMRLLGGAVTLRATEDINDEGAEDAAVLPEDARARRDTLDELIIKKVVELATTREVTLRVPPDAVDSVKRSMEEFRGKKGKGMGLLLALGLMMKGMMAALAMGAIAMIAGKALTVGLMALTISAVIGLKKLASQGGGHGSYEVVNVAAPAHHHGRSLSAEDRNLDPYRAHAPPLQGATGDADR